MTPPLLRFYLGLVVPVLLLTGTFGLSGVLLSRAGEYLNMDDTIAKLEKTGGLFGSALHSQAFWYKQAVYRRVKPTIALHGSSRALLMRQAQFTAPFASTGMMRSLDEEAEILRALLPGHAPEILLFNIDYWWFHPEFETYRVKRDPAQAKISVFELLKPVKWLAQGKVRPSDIPAVLSGESPHVGMTAVMNNEGFDTHGTFWYGDSLTGKAEHKDVQFAATLAKLRTHNVAFARGAEISEKQWKTFTGMMAAARADGVKKIILFIPPGAGAVLKEMQGEDFRYIDVLKRRLAEYAAKNGFGYFDFYDPATLPSPDCEFVDGVHGGIVTYDRMLLRMARGDADLGRYVDTALLEAEIARYAGRASMLAGEIDFLGIGCRK